jgi:hypothetical protein
MCFATKPGSVGVLRLLLSMLVPVKGRILMGGVFPFGEFAFQAEGSCIRDWEVG